MLKQIMVVAAGGALGSTLRYLNFRLFHWVFERPVPLATFTVNVVGCLLMGMAYAWLVDKALGNENLRLFVMMGFLGALTTWSSFSLEAGLMLEHGQAMKAAIYATATILSCFTAFFVGIELAE
jgi:CrcB protein